MKCETLSEALAAIAGRYGKDSLCDVQHVCSLLTDLLPGRKDLRNALKHAISEEVIKKIDDACCKSQNEQKHLMHMCVQQCLDDLPLKQDVVEEVL
jgi:hypothetical protein